MIGTLLQLFWLFLGLSLLAVGSGNSVIPAIQNAAINVHHWMTGREFLELFAISRLSPGPGSLLVVVLVGQKAAGLAGAGVAALAMFAPSCLLVYAVSRLWHRYRERPWRELAERGLGPVAIGMVFASAIALVRGTEHAPGAYAITVLVALLLFSTRLNPLWLMAAAALAGWLLRL